MVAAGVRDQNPPESNTENIYICSYNVRSLLSPTRLILLQDSIKHLKWDIIGISEIRRPLYQIEEMDWCILCHTSSKKGQKGVGFIIKKKHKNNIKEFVEISDRVAVLKIEINKTPLTIIQAYAPTNISTNEDEVDNFY